MKKLALTTLSLALALSFAGCSDPEPYDATETGTIEDSDPRVEEDNSPYDEYTFEAAEGWQINIEMTSEFDNYLWLIPPGGGEPVQDDDGGEGTNASISTTATAGGRYTVRANSYDEAGRGEYTIHMSAHPGN